jgi:hypothetical protein
MTVPRFHRKTLLILRDSGIAVLVVVIAWMVAR